MKILLDLSETVLSKLQELADSESRSRKNYIETVLEKKVLDMNQEVKIVSLTVQPPKTNYVINTLPKEKLAQEIKPTFLNQFAAYVSEIKECKTISEIELVMKEAERDKNLSKHEKINLALIAKEYSKDFYND